MDSTVEIRTEMFLKQTSRKEVKYPSFFKKNMFTRFFPVTLLGALSDLFRG